MYPSGRISDIYQNSSKVILYSNAGETTQAVYSSPFHDTTLNGNVFVDLIGRGGGNFEMVMPKILLFKQ